MRSRARKGEDIYRACLRLFFDVSGSPTLCIATGELLMLYLTWLTFCGCTTEASSVTVSLRLVNPH